jgi:hypothetical protein
LLVFHAYEYINEIHGSRSKIPSKKSRPPALRGGFNFGVKGLNWKHMPQDEPVKYLDIHLDPRLTWKTHIPQDDTVKYLDIHLDPRLTWKTHIPQDETVKYLDIHLDTRLTW